MCLSKKASKCIFILFSNLNKWDISITFCVYRHVCTATRTCKLTWLSNSSSHNALKARTPNFEKLQRGIWLSRCQWAALNTILLFVFKAAPSLDVDTLLLRTHFSLSLLCFVSTSISLDRSGPCWDPGWTSNNEKKKERKRSYWRNVAEQQHVGRLLAALKTLNLSEWAEVT